MENTTAQQLENEFYNIDNELFDNSEIYNHFKNEKNLENALEHYNIARSFFFDENIELLENTIYYDKYENQENICIDLKEEMSSAREKYYEEFGFSSDQLNDECSNIIFKCNEFFKEAKKILDNKYIIYVFNDEQASLLKINGLIVNDNIIINI